ncbi:Non-canonical purine NTP pyrophosphatase,dITP/XTP pyrophosphatase,Xanthosine triphosphate pyrophosphatase,non-canonical purine NTP pyrophosphatase, RdgB/HAM1 family,Ham1 family [Chlamydia serpentis]|uniref:dITP/XTP pyrophosphatase n=1 Tax=Chlamydia serpentis TaxID=1967782 RepID=A0A2R8FBT4_9CHLA|nr:RdgB/HAM1 family non-canonical purine NTP pyrophosphatase [Chlamydia serpentis]SPN73890.1 Non-canonical purine NTP pyrophosphatase,dITP/XTP pyrophosphatase,Xanthosine triphosphate pyrophosphatase,non-canonical purine NTP pyrophosphatase, RdgB/HAM1 family,Ham1 family [Chlamydia serpentis]
MKIVIASSHGYKIRETKTFLKRLGDFDIFSLCDFPGYKLPQENGDSTTTNALTKGIHAANHLGCWVIADDTMLKVPALNGLPGALSARFAGPDAYDKDHRKKLLNHMASLESIVDRAAYFECCVVLVSPDQEVFQAHGICEGYISHHEKGSSGFGYDPIFVKYDYKQTFAELTEEIKNQVSHRAKALQKLAPYLQNVFEKHLLSRN